MIEFDLTVGGSLPAIGLGLWKIENDKAAQMVVDAIDIGYRHLDSACDYGNECEVGQGITKAISDGKCSRDDLWVTSKLWNTYHHPDHVRAACQRTLRDLQVDYLDLYLIHFPIAQTYVDPDLRYPPGWFTDPTAAEPKFEIQSVPIIETWRAMEELVDAGLVGHIGVSNFGTSLIRDLLSQCRLRPSVLQVELHPYLTQEKLIRYCASEGIAVTGFSPLGAPSYVPLGMATDSDSVIESSEVKQIAETHGKSAAQIILRWGVQRGTSIIPKTSRTERLKENFAIFDFELSDQEMALISGMNRNQRFNDPGVFCEQAFNTFCPIYE